VDVVIDGVAGPLAGQAIASLAPGGRYVSVGYSGGTTATIEVTDPDLEVRAHTGSASASSPLRRFTRPG
jgi:NADPH:quinone reductase-like Zn-dependent oxidoreductase